MNILDWMIEKRLAKNLFNARHIADRLQLNTLAERDQRRRVEAYRRWRDAGESLAVCFENVLAGKEPPKELFEVAK